MLPTLAYLLAPQPAMLAERASTQGQQNSDGLQVQIVQT